MEHKFREPERMLNLTFLLQNAGGRHALTEERDISDSCSSIAALHEVEACLTATAFGANSAPAHSTTSKHSEFNSLRYISNLPSLTGN